VKRLRAALFALAMVVPVLAQAQNPGDTWEERQSARERRQEQRQERREEQRERMQRMRERWGNDGVHLRILRSYALAEGETASEPVVVVGGSATIDGHVEDDVVVIGGRLRLGPKAVVDGNVVTVGGGIDRDPAATIRGSVDEGAVPWPSITFDPDWNTSAWWRAAAIWGSFIRMSIILCIAMLLTLVAPQWIGSIAGRPAAISGVTGLVAEVLGVPALIVLTIILIVSIIGIPLLLGMPFLLAAIGFLWVAGFTGVAVRLGRMLRGVSVSGEPTVVDLLVGYTVIVAVTVTGQLLALSTGWFGIAWSIRSAGLLIEFVAWTIGLGAVLTSLFGSRREMPPPLPV